MDHKKHDSMYNSNAFIFERKKDETKSVISNVYQNRVAIFAEEQREILAY
jgi:hypothetical protein